MAFILGWEELFSDEGAPETTVKMMPPEPEAVSQSLNWLGIERPPPESVDDFVDAETESLLLAASQRAV